MSNIANISFNGQYRKYNRATISQTHVVHDSDLNRSNFLLILNGKEYNNCSVDLYSANNDKKTITLTYGKHYKRKTITALDQKSYDQLIELLDVPTSFKVLSGSLIRISNQDYYSSKGQLMRAISNET